MLKTLSDSELIKHYQGGNESAFEILLKRHKDKVYTHIYYLVKNEELANDFFQDTFFKVIHNLKTNKYNDEGKFLPWVMRIAHNMVIDQMRKQKRYKITNEWHGSEGEEFNIFDILEIDSGDNIEEHLMSEQCVLRLQEMVQDLPEAQKEILEMRLYQRIAFKDIAEMKGISINTALGRMRYAVMNIKKMIEEKDLVL